MKITKDKIEKIAFLARLDLNDIEKEKYRNQLSDVFNFLDSLKDSGSSNLETLGLVSDFKNQLRDDEIIDCDQEERETALGQSAEKELNQIKVKRVL